MVVQRPHKKPKVEADTTTQHNPVLAVWYFIASYLLSTVHEMLQAKVSVVLLTWSVMSMSFRCNDEFVDSSK